MEPAGRTLGRLHCHGSYPVPPGHSGQRTFPQSAQGGAGATQIVTASASSAAVKSSSLPSTVAVLVSVPATAALAWIVKVAVSPAARSPTFHAPVAGSYDPVDGVA